MRYAIITICLLVSIIGIFISNVEIETYAVSVLCILLIINQIFWAISLSNRNIPGKYYIKRTQVTIKEKYLNIIGIIVVTTYYYFSSSFNTSLFIFFISLLLLWVVNSVVYNIKKPWVLAINEDLLYLNKETVIKRSTKEITEILKSSLSDELIIKFKKNSDEIRIPMYWFDKKDFAIFLNQLQKCSSGIIRVSEDLKKV